ncbi:MAG: lipopolysaccharide biosynthesis protein [Hyphomicrobiales bacterium]|nr:lipopolysaccharide biosynthesis protein [Hyphomicrobiales bacterium]
MALPRFARNTLHSTLAGAATAVGAFLSVVVVARMLGPVGAGHVALGIWIVGVLVTACDLGLPMTVARFIPDLSARKQREDVANFAPAFFPILLGTTALGAAGLLVVWRFNEPIDAILPVLPFDDVTPLVWVALAVLFVLQAIGNYGLSNLRGHQEFDRAASLSSISFLLQLAGVAAGGWYFGIPGALVGYGGGSLLLALHALTHIRIGGRIEPELRARAWRFSMSSWGVGLIAAIVWSRTELAFLNHFRGPQEAGLYSIANTLATVATQAPLLMTGGLLALFSERFAVGDHEGLKNAFESAVRFMSFLIFPACFGAAALAPSLVPALFGQAFAGAAQPAAILVAAQAFGAVSTVSSALLFATERNYFLVWTGIAGSAAVICSGLFVIPAYGLMGAVIGRSIIQFAIVAASFVYIGRALACPTPYFSVLRIMAAAAGCALVARWIVLVAPGWIGILIAIGVGAAVYFALVRLLRALPQDDVGRLQEVAGKMPAWLSPFVTPLVQFFER